MMGFDYSPQISEMSYNKHFYYTDRKTMFSSLTVFRRLCDGSILELPMKDYHRGLWFEPDNVCPACLAQSKDKERLPLWVLEEMTENDRG